MDYHKQDYGNICPALSRGHYTCWTALETKTRGMMHRARVWSIFLFGHRLRNHTESSAPKHFIGCLFRKLAVVAWIGRQIEREESCSVPRDAAFKVPALLCAPADFQPFVALSLLGKRWMAIWWGSSAPSFSPWRRSELSVESMRLRCVFLGLVNAVLILKM